MQQVTAIIFAEHQKLSEENSLLKQQILSLEELNQLCEKTDSLNRTEIKIYKEKAESDDRKIQQLESSQKKTVKFSIAGGIVLFILGLLL